MLKKTLTRLNIYVHVFGCYILKGIFCLLTCFSIDLDKNKEYFSFFPKMLNWFLQIFHTKTTMIKRNNETILRHNFHNSSILQKKINKGPSEKKAAQQFHNVCSPWCPKGMMIEVSTTFQIFPALPLSFTRTCVKVKTSIKYIITPE